MLTSLKLKNFTVFSEAEFQFSPALNVIIGENGAGKSHILKIAYSALYVSAGIGNRERPVPPEEFLHISIQDKLYGVFRPDGLQNLVHDRAKKGSNWQVALQDDETESQFEFSSNLKGKREVVVTKLPKVYLDQFPIYLPTHELLTIYPGFSSLYQDFHLSFEEIWSDTCIRLGSPYLKSGRAEKAKRLLKPLEEALGGSIELSADGRFYLATKNKRVEIHLVAEGHRKLAMVAQLIANGSIRTKGCLFWDEPEANLNPKIVKTVAQVILHLCQNGVQVFIATHSLFLLRELDILLKTKEFLGIPTRFFGLHPESNGVIVQSGDTVDDVGDIDALDEDLRQSDRYLSTEVI